MVDSTREQRDAAEFAAAPRPADRLRRFVGVILGVYWLTLFLATHVPIRESPASIPGADKIVHFAAYGILGMLLAFFVGLRRTLNLKVVVTLVAGIAAYGAVDEWLQIPVGRTCELADWAFDVLGASIGVGLVALMARWHTREDPRDRDASSPA